MFLVGSLTIHLGSFASALFVNLRSFGKTVSSTLALLGLLTFITDFQMTHIGLGGHIATLMLLFSVVFISYSKTVLILVFIYRIFCRLMHKDNSLK